MKRNWMILLAGLLATGLIAAGCGGDDDDDDGGDGGEALTKEEFLAQGNAICEEGNAELNAAADEVFQGGQRPSPEELETFVNDSFVPNIQGQIDDIRALGPPEEDEDTINGILDDAEDALAEVEEDPQGTLGAEAGQTTDPFAEVNAQLADYGLTACSDG
jgi:hypothetical protein